MCQYNHDSEFGQISSYIIAVHKLIPLDGLQHLLLGRGRGGEEALLLNRVAVA